MTSQRMPAASRAAPASAGLRVLRSYALLLAAAVAFALLLWFVPTVDRAPAGASTPVPAAPAS